MLNSILLVILLSIERIFALPQCSEIRVRKEFRDMTKDEWKTFKDAVRKITIDSDSGIQYDKWTATHLYHASDAHNTPEFLPWHRLFVWQFENALRSVNSSITVPYWDWSHDSQDPLRSRIFKKGYFDFRPGPRGDCSWRRIHRVPHCLLRNYTSSSFGTFHDAGTIDRLVRDKRLRYDRFRQLIENAPHGAVHASIGGPGGDMTTMISPNDPIFWLHHSFIDKIWADHQKTAGFDYGGRMKGRPARLTDILHPFEMSVRESLNITDLCYSFQSFSRARMSLASSNTLPTRLTPLKSNHSTLIPPNPLPLYWINEHGLDESEVRENEKFLVELMESVNSAPVLEENGRLTLEEILKEQKHDNEVDGGHLSSGSPARVDKNFQPIVVLLFFIFM